jgi:hypothetical protein
MGISHGFIMWIQSEFVSWDDVIPNIPIYGKIKFMFQTTNQVNNGEEWSIMTGLWLTYSSEKYESQWEGCHPIYEMENKIMFETTN